MQKELTSEPVLSRLSGWASLLGLRQRPQEPRQRPYRVEAVQVEAGDIQLAGELTRPHGEGPFPAVVLLSGSGPQDRNETLAGHKPFLVLSDYLTRHGLAVLRYDDRGVGKSTGNFAAATAEDFAADAAAALSWLQKRVDIDSTSTGFLGHSEGGYTAALAARQAQPGFMIFLAGAAKRLLPDVATTQCRDILISRDVAPQKRVQAERQIAQLTAILRESESVDVAKNRLRAYLQQDGLSRTEVRASVSFWATPWGMWYANYDPLPALRAFRGPVLALYGETDLQVSATENAPAMAAALSHSGSVVNTLPGLNHLFQPSRSGKVEDYYKIDTTIDPNAMGNIIDWLNRSLRHGE